MKSIVHIKSKQSFELPQEFQGDDVRYSEDLVAYFLHRFTAENDVVFDPFAGFGTTLWMAEAMGRVPYGIEYDQARADYIRTRLKKYQAHIIHGDSRNLLSYQLPPFDLSMTSPPYMNKFDHPQNPLTAYTTKSRGYETYLQDLQQIYGQVRQLMKPEARVIIQAQNLKSEAGVTPLAWDIGQAVTEVLDFEGEVIVYQDNEDSSYGFDHSYCLIFSNPG
ncbi:MAG: DNA methyltransferase [Anaerolineae bacterium]|nr:DNA methyltransferase [Anaerolineae bacterium]